MHGRFCSVRNSEGNYDVSTMLSGNPVSSRQGALSTMLLAHCVTEQTNRGKRRTRVARIPLEATGGAAWEVNRESS